MSAHITQMCASSQFCVQCHRESIYTTEMGRCYESGFFCVVVFFGGGGRDKGEPVYQNTTDTNKPYPHKTSSLVSSQKGELPTTVQCKKYEQIAVEAPYSASVPRTVTREVSLGCWKKNVVR